MINYNKNELINTTLKKYYETFACTLDTSDYVPEKFNNRILKYIFKNLKKVFRQIDREDRIYQAALKRKETLKKKQVLAKEKEKRALERKLKRKKRHKRSKAHKSKKVVNRKTATRS